MSIRCIVVACTLLGVLCAGCGTSQTPIDKGEKVSGARGTAPSPSGDNNGLGGTGTNGTGANNTTSSTGGGSGAR